MSLEKLPLNSLKDLSEREISLLVVDRLNGLIGHIEVFVTLIETKVSREEHRTVADRVATCETKIRALENSQENKVVGDDTVKALKAKLWSGLFAGIAILEFLILVAKSMPSEV